MEWTEESTRNFINSYHTKEVLWDTKNPKYYNEIKKHDAWEEVAVEFRTIVDECKKKLNSLLSALRREKTKIKKNHGTGKGSSDIYESTWFAFKNLQFLWDKNKVRETQSTILDEEGGAEKEISGDEATLEDNDSSETAVQKDIEATPARKRQKKNVDAEKLDEAFKILLEASNEATNIQANECQIFGALVAKKLAKYSAQLQSSVQQDMMNILFKADRIHHRQDSTSFDDSQYRTHTLYPNSMAQHKDSQLSNFNLQQSQLPSPAYKYASSSISNYSRRRTPVNSSAHQVLNMPDIELENL